MGRKIPGKKHRGVKDPAVQQEKKLADLKTKINAPPSNPNDQEIPKSLQRIMDLTRKVKDGLIPLRRKRKKKKNSALITVGKEYVKENSVVSKKRKPEKPIPVFKQRPGENEYVFLNRVNNMVQNVLLENQFEQKFGVDVLRNPKTGEVVDVVKKSKDPVEEMIKQAKKEKKQKKKKLKGDTVQLTKAEKRKLKREKRKNKHNDDLDEFSQYKDEVKFGEIVHEPPSLKVPKKLVRNEALRPGQKDLILKEVLQKNVNNLEKVNKTSSKVKKSTTGIDKKGKRKNLPVATRRLLENHREEVVKAYKLLKNKNK